MGFLDTINSAIIGILGPFGPLMIVGFLGLVLIFITLPFLLFRREDPFQRLRKSKEADDSEKEDTMITLRQVQGETKLEKYSQFLEPQDEEEYTAVRLKLLQAGYPSPDAVRNYHFAQFALGIGFLVAGLLYALANSGAPDQTTKSTILSILIPGVVGYMMPKYWVNRRQQSRQEEIVNGFPDALDMMLVCVEAGQSLDQSIIRVAEEIRAGFPALADEFEVVSHEMKAGKDRVSVLRDMAERCGVPDVSSFVTVLIQSASFGTSIADALRVFSSEMREKRVTRAEEKANTLPTKMTLVTMMLTVPPLLIILIGPSIYSMAQTFSKMNF
jgi:tight adherence protein C